MHPQSELQRSLIVSEIFGPTFQGEGPSAGQQAVFLRLLGCNLACGWCDTPYTWDWTRFNPKTEGRTMSIYEVLYELEAKTIGRKPILVITGGEPMLQSQALLQLFDTGLQGLFRRVEIETNGTKHPLLTHHRNIHYNISPKLRNSGNPIDETELSRFVDRADRIGSSHILKFVVESPDELDEVERLLPIHYDPAKVWIMPQTINAEELTTCLRNLSEPVLYRGWNLTSRMHVQLWQDQRGH